MLNIYQKYFRLVFLVLLFVFTPSICASNLDYQGHDRIDVVVLNSDCITFRCVDSSAVRAIIPHERVKIYSENGECSMGCSQYINTGSTEVQLFGRDSVEFCDKQGVCFVIRRSLINRVTYSDGRSLVFVRESQDSISRRRKSDENPSYTLKEVIGGVVTIGVVMGAIIFAVHNVDLEMPDLWPL